MSDLSLWEQEEAQVQKLREHLNILLSVVNQAPYKGRFGDVELHARIAFWAVMDLVGVRKRIEQQKQGMRLGSGMLDQRLKEWVEYTPVLDRDRRR